jgi:hypothetical protein
LTYYGYAQIVSTGCFAIMTWKSTRRKKKIITMYQSLTSIQEK